MRVVFHYAAGPDLAARLAGLDGLEGEVCPEADDARFAALMAEAEMGWTAPHQHRRAKVRAFNPARRGSPQWRYA